MSNQETVKDIYAAFGRGDIPAILDRLAPDVRWDHLPDGGGAQRHGVPWLAERTGPDEVAGFFDALGALEFHEFAPTAILGDGDTVVALIDEDATVRATGERIRDATAHVWTFGPDGRVAEFRHIADTVKHVEAYAARALA
jgi:ketosteroid isomerase-like protein